MGSFERELSFLQTMKHPNIVEMIDAHNNPPTVVRAKFVIPVESFIVSFQKFMIGLSSMLNSSTLNSRQSWILQHWTHVNIHDYEEFGPIFIINRCCNMRAATTFIIYKSLQPFLTISLTKCLHIFGQSSFILLIGHRLISLLGLKQNQKFKKLYWRRYDIEIVWCLVDLNRIYDFILNKIFINLTI